MRSPHLIDVVDSLTQNSCSRARQFTTQGISSNNHVFSEARHSLLELRNNRQHFNLMLVGHFKQQNHSYENTKINRKNMTLSR